MEITPTSLSGFYTTFIAANYYAAYDNAPVWWKEVATLMPSKTATNVYGWMAKIKRMRKWLGERQVNVLSAYSYSLTNDRWEDTIEISRENFEDDTYGIFQPDVAALGAAAAKWPDDMLQPVIEAGTSTLCFDGQDFFSASHPISKYQPGLGTYSNNFTGMGLTLDNYQAVRVAMRKFVGEDGKRLNINPNLLVVPPALEHEALRIAKGDFLAENTTAGATPVGPSTNVLRGTCEVLVIPELTSDTAWYLMDTRKPVKPFIFQQRLAPEITPLISPNDPNVFWTDQFIWGVRSRGAAGFSLPFLCARATS